MTQGRYGALISAYIDGELTAEERAELLAHVCECHECAGLLRDYRQIRTSFRALESLAPPPSLAPVIHERTSGQGAAPRVTPLGAARGLTAVAAALAVLLLALLPVLHLAGPESGLAARLALLLGQGPAPTATPVLGQWAVEPPATATPEPTITSSPTPLVAAAVSPTPPPTVTPSPSPTAAPAPAGSLPAEVSAPAGGPAGSPPAAGETPAGGLVANPTARPPVPAALPVTAGPSPPPATATPQPAAATRIPASATPLLPPPTVTATATRSPTRTPVPTATPSPTPTATPPSLLQSFAALYNQKPELRTRLGAPLESERAAEAVRQSFERGAMEWLAEGRLIYVFYTDGRAWALFPDTWTPDDAAAPGDPPPPGRLQPRGAFGKLWSTTPTVRERLGWATAAEQPYTGVSQRFERGLLLLSTASSSVVALYEDGSWQRFDSR